MRKRGLLIVDRCDFCHGFVINESALQVRRQPAVQRVPSAQIHRTFGCYWSKRVVRESRADVAFFCIFDIAHAKSNNCKTFLQYFIVSGLVLKLQNHFSVEWNLNGVFIECDRKLARSGVQLHTLCLYSVIWHAGVQIEAFHLHLPQWPSTNDLQKIRAGMNKTWPMNESSYVGSSGLWAAH